MKKYYTRIANRLIGSFLILLAVMALTTGFALWRLHAANDIAHRLVDDKLAKQQLAADWLAAVSRNGVRANAIAKSDSLEVGEYFGAQLGSAETAIQQIEKHASSKIDSDHEKALVAAIAQARQHYIQTRDQVFQYKESGRTIEVEQLLASQMEPRFTAYESAIQALLTHQKKQADLIAKQSNEAYQSSIWLLAALGTSALLIGAVLAWLLTNSLVRPLRNAIDLASSVADGDLTAEAKTERQDEIGDLLRALDRMMASLSKAVGGVREGVDFMGHSLKNIAADNAKLASRTSEQAASLEQVAASMEELSSTVKENAGNAEHAAQLAGSASDIARRGGEAVLQVVGSMDLISHSSQKINSIIGVIDEIAFQTNILALNAAVEAARAGEQGRGFAVVANEVRNLAKRSSVAAKEIKDLIQQSGEEINRGGKLVKNAGATMNEIVESVGKVTDLVADISVASKEQSNALVQVNDAVVYMDQMTQQNAALVVDAAEASEALRLHSAQLVHAMSVFRISGIQSVTASPEAWMHAEGDSQSIAVELSARPARLKLVNAMH